MLLANKNIVIVGGTSGIGFSAASVFVNEGANVIAIGRNPDQIKKTKKLLENHETTIQGNAADSTTAQEGIKLAVDKNMVPYTDYIMLPAGVGAVKAMAHLYT